jgi:hypothetical protein
LAPFATISSLFLALDQDFDVDRQGSVGAHQRF